jgi:hypothetical protein
MAVKLIDLTQTGFIMHAETQIAWQRITNGIRSYAGFFLLSV